MSDSTDPREPPKDLSEAAQELAQGGCGLSCPRRPSQRVYLDPSITGSSLDQTQGQHPRERIARQYLETNDAAAMTSPDYAANGPNGGLVAIIDNGTALMKVGMSCDDKPTSVFPSLVGIPRRRHRKKCDRDFYCGDEVTLHRDNLTVANPVENSIVENFQHMEMLWDYCFVDILKIQPEAHPVMLTEPPYNPKPNRERMVELMFEAFGVPSLNISTTGILALMGQGRTTGLILDSGAGSTHCLPVFDGFGMPHAIKKMELCGNDLSTYLAKLLAKVGISLASTALRAECEKMKETCCYVSLDPCDESVNDPRVYKLPDGQAISLYDECWKVPEALFTPSTVGCEDVGGIASLVWEAVQSCEIDVRRTLMQNIVLTGGCTMFPNFDKRLSREVQNLAPSNLGMRIVASNNASKATATDGRDVHGYTAPVGADDRVLNVWQGGQVLANLKSMQEDNWMTADDYDECGPAFIHDKITVKYD